MHPARWTRAFVLERTGHDLIATLVGDLATTVIETGRIQINHINGESHRAFRNTGQREFRVRYGVGSSRVAVSDVTP